MLVIASRGSQLALWQARHIARRLTELGHECRIEIIKTTGDKITDVPLAKVGTVSYTHLDVYKRQGLYRRRGHRAEPLSYQ